MKKKNFGLPFPVVNARKRYGLIKRKYKLIDNKTRTARYWAEKNRYKALSGDENFDRLAKALRKAGYKVRVEYIGRDHYKFTSIKVDPPYYFATITGNKLRAGFCTPNNDSYSYINGKIAMDRSDMFDKWNKCVYSIDLPTNEREVEAIFEAIHDTLYVYYENEKPSNSSGPREV